MIIERDVAIRDLYSDDLREALGIFSSPGRNEDQDIVAAARSIIYFPDEDVVEHRYTGDYYKLLDNMLWPTAIGGMRPVWRPHAKRVDEALRNCRKLQARTSVIIHLGRDKLKTEEATLFCTKAGVVWRYVGPDWNPTMTEADEIELRVRTCKSALQPVRGVIHFSKKGRSHERRFLVDRGAAFASESLLSEAEGETPGR